MRPTRRQMTCLRSRPCLQPALRTRNAYHTLFLTRRSESWRDSPTSRFASSSSTATDWKHPSSIPRRGNSWRKTRRWGGPGPARSGFPSNASAESKKHDLFTQCSSVKEFHHRNGYFEGPRFPLQKNGTAQACSSARQKQTVLTNPASTPLSRLS